MFGGGTSRVQPVYVGDLARAVEVLSRNDPEVDRLAAGKYIEAGGPDGRSILLVAISCYVWLNVASFHLQRSHANCSAV